MALTIDLRTHHYPENGKYSFLNFAVGIWLEERIAFLKKKGLTDKVSRYEKMNPDNMMMEPPVVFKKNYVVTNVLDRVGGLLVLDQKVKLVEFDDFLKRANKSSKVDSGAKQNSPLAEVIGEETEWSSLSDKLKQVEGLSATPIYWLTKNKEDNSYHVLFDGEDTSASFDLFVEWVLNGYSFESIVLTESADPTGIESFDQASCGKITVKDKMLAKKTVNINFINLNTIKKLMV